MANLIYNNRVKPIRMMNAINIAPKEIRCIKFILFSLLIWFALAQLSTWIYPDKAGQQNALKSYLRYAVRNGGVFLIFASIIQVFRLMNQSGDLTFFNYIKTNAHKIPKRSFNIIASLCFGILTFAIFMMSYSTIKTRIPVINPYKWDEAFANLDRLIFIGHDPWTVFAKLYDYPVLIRILDVIYDVWAVILVGLWTLSFISKKHEPSSKYRFPLALMITWFLGGTLMAILFSSAGPCYYGLVTALEDPFAAQMILLSDINDIKPLRAFDYQNILWSVYDNGSLGLGGISAMPSMHCATSALLILLAWNHTYLRWVAITFFGVIFITSIILAWHYAVDGLFAIPIAIFAWWLAGRLLNRVSQNDSGFITPSITS